MQHHALPGPPQLQGSPGALLPPGSALAAALDPLLPPRPGRRRNSQRRGGLSGKGGNAGSGGGNGGAPLRGDRLRHQRGADGEGAARGRRGVPALQLAGEILPGVRPHRPGRGPGALRVLAQLLQGVRPARALPPRRRLHVLRGLPRGAARPRQVHQRRGGSSSLHAVGPSGLLLPHPDCPVRAEPLQQEPDGEAAARGGVRDGGRREWEWEWERGMDGTQGLLPHHRLGQVPAHRSQAVLLPRKLRGRLPGAEQRPGFHHLLRPEAAEQRQRVRGAGDHGEEPALHRALRVQHAAHRPQGPGHLLRHRRARQLEHAHPGPADGPPQGRGALQHQGGEANQDHAQAGAALGGQRPRPAGQRHHLGHRPHGRLLRRQPLAAAQPGRARRLAHHGHQEVGRRLQILGSGLVLGHGARPGHVHAGQGLPADQGSGVPGRGAPGHGALQAAGGAARGQGGVHEPARLVRGVPHHAQLLRAQRLHVLLDRPLRPEGDGGGEAGQGGAAALRARHGVAQGHAAALRHRLRHHLRPAALHAGHGAQPGALGLPHHPHQPAAAAGLRRRRARLQGVRQEVEELPAGRAGQAQLSSSPPFPKTRALKLLPGKLGIGTLSGVEVGVLLGLVFPFPRKTFAEAIEVLWGAVAAWRARPGPLEVGFCVRGVGAAPAG
ncbi:hypothetical protein DV515_00013700 [Chloebia gouldiae]|uniref:Uncharacterized protein n=1 Tax=Chloebia gouldiae TaxID=44316 RepID=A0A3L8S094_CHLGU|nr:hypothetical protein DV515_00013700 [Chloebia gouldiae]